MFVRISAGIVCLNIQDFLRRVSEDGFTQKRTMLTFLVTESMFSIFFKFKYSPFRDKIPQLYNFSKLLPQRWLLVSHISFYLLKFYKEKCPEKKTFQDLVYFAKVVLKQNDNHCLS